MPELSSENEDQREEAPSPALYQVELRDLLITALMIGAALTINPSTERHNNAPLVAPLLFGGAAVAALLIHSRFAYFRIDEWVIPRGVVLILWQIISIIGASLLFNLICPPVQHWYERYAKYSGIYLCDAQTIYKRMDYDKDGILEYAKTMHELFETRPGAANLLLIDEQMVNAETKSGLILHLGYHFALLTSQGTHAAGGQKSYLDDKGNLAYGFAYLLYPKTYGKNGQLSFLIASDGRVLEKDLGVDTAKTAPTITSYDPDETWNPSH